MPSEPHRSGPLAGTTTSGELTIRSGSPSCHLSALAKSSAVGMSAGLPRGAPPSTHFAIIAISASLNDVSCLKPWMPMFFSTNHRRTTATAPLRDHRDPRVAQRRILLEALDADVLLDEPRRHHAGVRANRRARLDRSRPRRHVVVRGGGEW